MRPPPIDPLEAAVVRQLLVSIAEEMGAVLERSSHSPNIKERRDHSCALFDARGRLLAQAAHIPVHLGAFPMMMNRLAVEQTWEEGDVLACNDPECGGTHLPDISVVAPVFHDGALQGFVANRAHHADVGGMYPGSMGPARSSYAEGLIIPPVKLVRAGKRDDDIWRLVLRNVRTPEERSGDLSAQLGSLANGVSRWRALLHRWGSELLCRHADAAILSTQRATHSFIRRLPGTPASAEDQLDAAEDQPVPYLRVALSRVGRKLRIDFTGTSASCPAPLNAPPAVTASAAYYCLACLLPAGTDLNQGILDCLQLVLPENSLVCPGRASPVAAGNVETSQRLVDLLLRAFSAWFPDRIPAASQGTMNNISFGGETPVPWSYYETIGGGAGAGPGGPGASGIHCHMSNTRNTPVEALEFHYPMRIRAYALRTGSGGAGGSAGGEGVVRETEVLEAATVSLLTDRRGSAPYGLAGGGSGANGRNTLIRSGELEQILGARGSWALRPGDRVRVETPGGGAYRRASDP